MLKVSFRLERISMMLEERRFGRLRELGLLDRVREVSTLRFVSRAKENERKN